MRNIIRARAYLAGLGVSVGGVTVVLERTYINCPYNPPLRNVNQSSLTQPGGARALRTGSRVVTRTSDTTGRQTKVAGQSSKGKRRYLQNATDLCRYALTDCLLKITGLNGPHPMCDKHREPMQEKRLGGAVNADNAG